MVSLQTNHNNIYMMIKKATSILVNWIKMHRISNKKICLHLNQLVQGPIVENLKKKDQIHNNSQKYNFKQYHKT
jgi:hypothetical protein